MTMDDVPRRCFLALLGGAAAVWSTTLYAQQRVPTIGVLVTGNPNPEPFLKGFREGLAHFGYAEGRNIRLEVRSAEGRGTLLPERAAELVRLKVDVIVGFLTPAVQAARHATSDIPIVMAPAGDPVGTGLVSSLARPGGNITGMSAAAAEVAAKNIELIRELFPSARRVAVLANETDPFTTPFLAQIGQGARRLGLGVESIMARPADPQQGAFEAMSAKRVDAVIIQGTMIRQETAELAIKHWLPSFGSNRLWPVNGGLMAYAPSFDEVYREAAGYVDKILKGRKPADLPVQQSSRFDLIVNLKTAKAIGLTIPESFLLRANEVIE
jgi:putative ABC transport system substrate-binding protein